MILVYSSLAFAQVPVPTQPGSGAMFDTGGGVTVYRGVDGQVGTILQFNDGPAKTFSDTQGNRGTGLTQDGLTIWNTQRQDRQPNQCCDLTPLIPLMQQEERR